MTTSPIAGAIAPQRDEAVARSVAYMKADIEEFTTGLLGKNLTEAVPYPNSGHGKGAYQALVARYNRARSLMITRRDSYNMDAPVWAESVDTAAVERELERTARDAASQFDSFVVKLEGKVGKCDAASVEGFIWYGSTLIVYKGERVERWHTKQIVNVSSLGKLFNQWPTRLIKE